MKTVVPGTSRFGAFGFPAQVNGELHYNNA